MNFFAVVFERLLQKSLSFFYQTLNVREEKFEVFKLESFIENLV